MTSSEVLLARLITSLEGFDRDGFRSTIDAATQNGMAIPEVLDLLIGPAQHWVGAQWESGSWNVAQEHLATAITAQCVDSLSADDVATQEGTVLITCAEGEWHTLGLSIVAAGLRSYGYETVTLGGPLPAGQLLPFLHELAPKCVTVSCQMPGNLPGARRMAATAREAGTAAIVGGSGVTKQRARYLGSSGFAAGIQGLGLAVAAVDPKVTPIEELTHERALGFEWVDLHIHSLAAELASTSRNPNTESALEGVWMLRSLNAALLCDEPSILRDQAMWQTRRSKLGGETSMSDMVSALKTVVSAGPSIVGATLDEGTRDVIT